MIVITLILLTILIYMTIKVCRLVWATDKAVPIMLFTLCTTLLALLSYESFLISSKKNPEWCCDTTSSCHCMAAIFTQLPAFFLANAVILNLNKWIYFKMKINAFIKVGFGVSCDVKESIDT